MARCSSPAPGPRGGEFRYPRRVTEPAPSEALRTPAWARTIDAIPPGMRYRLAEVLRLIAAGDAFERVRRARLDKLLDAGEPWLGAAPELADVGHWLIEARHPVE